MSCLPPPRLVLGSPLTCCASSTAAVQSAAVAALQLSTAQPRNLTHCLVLSFEPNSTWQLGDPPALRSKLITGSTQTDAEVLQNLHWMGDPNPVAMLRWMRSQMPKLPQPRGLGWDVAPIIILLKTSEHANAEWDRKGIPLSFSMLVQNTYTPTESIEGWFEKLAAELASGGGSEGGARYGPITVQRVA